MVLAKDGKRSTHSANVIVDSAVECDVHALDDLEALTGSHPTIKIRLFKNLCLGLSRKLRKANCERAVLEE